MQENTEIDLQHTTHTMISGQQKFQHVEDPPFVMGVATSSFQVDQTVLNTPQQYLL